MKTVEKSRLTKSQKLAIILSSVLLFLVAAIVVLAIIFANRGDQAPVYKLPDVRTDLGESVYAGLPVVYERLTESEIKYMLVSNNKIERNEETGENVKKTYNYALNRYAGNGEFWLSYDLGDGEGVKDLTPYMPPILDAEQGFSYEDLYAIEGSDGYGTMSMISYLLSAVGTVYFTERIDLPQDEAARQEILREYGLAGDDAEVTVVSFAYGKRGSDGKFIEEDEDRMHHITIGSPALSGYGFYFRVDGRSCVYYTHYESLKYAKLGFESFVKGSLVASGLSSDKSFEPLLTTQFTEWKNQMHESGAVVAGSTVVTLGNVHKPVKESAEYAPADGYTHNLEEYVEYDLSKLPADITSDPDALKIYNALVGKTVGAQTDLYLTLLSERYSTSDMLIDFADAAELVYRYEITAIESIVDYKDGGNEYECIAAGTQVGSSNLIRVTYDYSIGTDKQNTVPRHAVIDLTEALIPDSARGELRAAAIGTLASPIIFDITYTKENAPGSQESLVISEITAIYKSNGATASEVTSDCYVSFKYYEKVGDRRGAVQSMFTSMADIKDDAKFSYVYSALLGKKVGKNLEITAYSNFHYYEALRSFTTYEITEIQAYVTSEQIVSFRFLNESERDPFYGESIYENLTGKYSLYGVDVDNCQNVLRILGGLENTTSSSSGLAGTTVAVGLTHKNKKLYNLYDYTIYFELPRIIGTEIIEPEDGGESIEDYNWDHVLGFTLYISKEDPATGLRYVGSDMYDVVATIDADTFEFLDNSFADFWARSSMIMLDIGYVDTFKLEFFMEDVKGSYDFEINKETIYVHPTYGNPSREPYEGAVEQDHFTVYVTESGDVMTDTALHSFALSTGGNRVALHQLYNTVMGGGQELVLPGSVEWVGVSNFMLAFQVMQMTPYGGSLTDGDKALASNSDLLMRITVGLDATNASSDHYVYEFYRISDRKIAVKTYMQTEAGNKVSGTESAEMYISTFAFKKMVNAYLSVFNAKDVDGEVPYADMPVG